MLDTFRVNVSPSCSFCETVMSSPRGEFLRFNQDKSVFNMHKYKVSTVAISVQLIERSRSILNCCSCELRHTLQELMCGHLFAQRIRKPVAAPMPWLPDAEQGWIMTASRRAYKPCWDLRAGLCKYRARCRYFYTELGELGTNCLRR